MKIKTYLRHKQDCALLDKLARKSALQLVLQAHKAKIIEKEVIPKINYAL